MLQQRFNALIKAHVPTTIWFLSLMSPLRKSTKIRKKEEVASLVPVIPTKWYGNHMVWSSDGRVWKCPCSFFSFFFSAPFLKLPTWTLWHSDDNIHSKRISPSFFFFKKPQQLMKEIKPNLIWELLLNDFPPLVKSYIKVF